MRPTPAAAPATTSSRRKAGASSTPRPRAGDASSTASPTRCARHREASMRFLRALWTRLAGTSPTNRDIDDELDAYVRLLTEEKIRAGLTPIEARRAALVEAGGLTQATEAVRDDRPGAGLDQLRQDVTYGLRLFRRAPG